MEINSPIYDTGVVMRVRNEYKVTDLPDTVGVNPSLLNAPIYVLHNTSTRSLDCIEVKWKQNINGEEVNKAFRFIRAATDPFPTVTHAKYLDILLAMYSQNWNADGILHFRYCDVLSIAGKSMVSRSRESIQQTILRYHRHVTEWENSWNGRKDTLTFTIIRQSSIIDTNGGIKHWSPRRSKNKEDWHTVIFDKEVVKALKDETKRILLTSLFQKLDHNTFCVYRYYYGYPDYFLDAQGVKKPNMIWRSLESLREIFRWTGQKNRFRNWIVQRFDELLEHGLIDKPIWNNDAVGIHCKNLKQLQQEKNTTIEIVDYDQKQSKKRTPMVKKIHIKDLTDEEILREYISRKSQGYIQKEKQEAIDLLFKNNLKKTALDLIRSHILQS